MDLTEIIRNLQAGDESAATLLVAVLAPQLYGYASAIAPDLSQANREEAVEEAVIALARSINRYSEEQASVETWARGFVRNSIKRARRKHGENLADMPVDSLSETVSGNSFDDGFDTTTERDARLSEILLSALTDAEYLLLTLRIVEKLPHSAIAQKFGVNEGAVKKRYQRLLGKIRTLIENSAVNPISSQK